MAEESFLFSIVPEASREAIGFARASKNATLSTLRREIQVQLDDLPTEFKFLLKSSTSGRFCPVSTKQETTEESSIYLPSGDVHIRLPCPSIRKRGDEVVAKIDRPNSSSSSSEFSMSDYDDHEGLLEEYGIAPKKAPPGFKQSSKTVARSDDGQTKSVVPSLPRDFKVVEREVWDQKTNKLRAVEVRTF